MYILSNASKCFGKRRYNNSESGLARGKRESASTGSGRSDLQEMASPWKGKPSTGVGGAILGKLSFLVKSAHTAF